MVAPKALRVLVDLTRYRPDGEGGGIKPALQELLRWLGQHSEAAIHFVYVLDPALDARSLSWLRPVDEWVSSLGMSRELAAIKNCSLVYCPFGLTDWACPGIPTITLIVDLLHKNFAETLSAPDCRFREEGFRSALLQTDLFQVISEYTGAQLQEHYQVPPHKIIRTYLPVHDRFPTSAPPWGKKPEPPFFFYPANAWVHKNHETLLVAYALYHQAAGPASWRLVLTGHPNEPMKRLQRIAGNLGIAGQVDFLGYVDDSRLALLWGTAGALVFPSLHEGFGLPLLEAMSQGVPIIASHCTAIPEITSDAALLVESRAPLALADGMRKIAEDPQLRSTLIGRGRNRITDFSQAVEFGRLLNSFYDLAHKASSWRRFGYHSADGVTDPLRIFGLPLTDAPQALHYLTQPLGVSRTLEFWCGDLCVEKIAVAANVPTGGHVVLPANSQVLSLHVPDSSRLSPVDPRTHGVRLTRLYTTTIDGVDTDLLSSPVAP